jgi:hypothetical protein
MQCKTRKKEENYTSYHRREEKRRERRPLDLGFWGLDKLETGRMMSYM